MLSERQKELIVAKVNAEIDLVFISERREEKIINKIVDLLEPLFEPALRAIISHDHVHCIKVALNESLDVDERATRISSVMRGEMSEPLSRELDRRIDSHLLPRRVEASFFRTIANKIIDEFVEWTVGKVDDKLQSMPLKRETLPNTMLNERQRHVAITRMNEEIDIPLISERREERMIAKVFDHIMPHVEPSLSMIMPDAWLNCIKLALNETLHLRDRRGRISKLVRGELAEPLSRELDGRVDVNFIPGAIKDKIFKLISKKFLDEIVEFTVGKVDEKLK